MPYASSLAGNMQRHALTVRSLLSAFNYPSHVVELTRLFEAQRAAAQGPAKAATLEVQA